MDNIKNFASNPTNLELIKIARELAYNDYNNRKAELHNQWLAESDTAWRLHKLKVAYPPIPSFPSEEEILNRASKLIEFLNTPRPDLAEEQPQEAVTAPTEPVEVVEEVEVIQEPQEIQEEIKEQPVEETKQQPTEPEQPKQNSNGPSDLEYARMRVAKKIGEPTVTSKVIPSVLQKLQDIKNTWK